jgi:hypothetical protein
VDDWTTTRSPPSAETRWVFVRVAHGCVSSTISVTLEPRYPSRSACETPPTARQADSASAGISAATGWGLEWARHHEELRWQVVEVVPHVPQV